MTPSLFHFYHVYADGAWEEPLGEHADALTRYGLYEHLESLQVGVVGAPTNREKVKMALAAFLPRAEVCNEADEGWEQETMIPLWHFTQTHDGLISYAHTKGAARWDPIQRPWRRSMTYYCFVHWQDAVAALTECEKLVAGCHWQYGGLDVNPTYGTGGMFGGTFWWTHCYLLRKNTRPGCTSRFEAEHWIGQITEHTPLLPELICDFNPLPIQNQYLETQW